MSVRKGQKVKFKVGRGWGLGKVVSVSGEKVTIKTDKSGHEVIREAGKLKGPDEDTDEQPSAPEDSPDAEEESEDEQ